MSEWPSWPGFPTISEHAVIGPGTTTELEHILALSRVMNDHIHTMYALSMLYALCSMLYYVYSAC